METLEKMNDWIIAIWAWFRTTKQHVVLGKWLCKIDKFLYRFFYETYLTYTMLVYSANTSFTTVSCGAFPVTSVLAQIAVMVCLKLNKQHLFTCSLEKHWHVLFFFFFLTSFLSGPIIKHFLFVCCIWCVSPYGGQRRKAALICRISFLEKFFMGLISIFVSRMNGVKCTSCVIGLV